MGGQINAYFVDAGEPTEYDPIDGEVYDCAVVRASSRGQAQYIFWLNHLAGEGDLTEFQYRVRLIKKGVDGSTGSVKYDDPLWHMTCFRHWGQMCICAHVGVEYVIPVGRMFYVLRFSVDGSWWMASIPRHAFTWNTLCRAIGELAIKTCNSPTRYAFPVPNLFPGRHLPPDDNNLPPRDNNLPYMDSTAPADTRTTDSVTGVL